MPDATDPTEPLEQDEQLEPTGETGTEAGDQQVEGTEAPPVESEESWIDDGVKQVAASYGMDEADLEDFGDLASFRRACRVIERRSLPPKPAEQEQKPAEKPPEQKPVEEEDIVLDPDEYAKENYGERELRLVKAAKRALDQNRTMREELKAVREQFGQFSQTFAQVQEAQARAMWEQKMRAFHELADGMDETRYGKVAANKQGDERDSKRRALYEAAETIIAGYADRAAREGKRLDLPPYKAILARAELMAFGDEIREADRKAAAQKIQEQAKRRRPVPGRARVAPEPPAPTKPPTVQDEVERIKNDAEWQAMMARHLEENGQ